MNTGTLIPAHDRIHIAIHPHHAIASRVSRWCHVPKLTGADQFRTDRIERVNE